MRFNGQVVIVTGSGRGIGRETALEFAAEGAAVVVADIDEASAREAAAEIAERGGRAHALAADVADACSVAAMVDDARARFGRLDVLVNNAAIGSNVPFLAMPLDEWQRNLDVNLTGVFLCSQAAARVMIEQRSGKIVNLASISGQRGGRGRAAYGAAKAGVILLTKVMAVELASYGIRVNAVSPGPVDTHQSRGTHTPATRRAYHDRLPVRRYGERSEIAAAILFLASDAASFVHGHVLNVDGGFNAAGLMFSEKDEEIEVPLDDPALAPHPQPTNWPG